MFNPKKNSGFESRWLRVETKSTGFLPNPQRAALSFKELLPQRHSPTRARVAREFSRAPQSLPHLSVCDFGLDMSIYMQVIFAPLRFRFAAKQVKQLARFQERFAWLFESPRKIVSCVNFFRDNHRDIARDGGKSFDLTKLCRRFLGN